LKLIFYQALVSTVYVWIAGTGPITGLPFYTATIVYLSALSESYIPNLLGTIPHMKGVARWLRDYGQLLAVAALAYLLIIASVYPLTHLLNAL
jgi:hypothetical protein